MLKSKNQVTLFVNSTTITRTFAISVLKRRLYTPKCEIFLILCHSLQHISFSHFFGTSFASHYCVIFSILCFLCVSNAAWVACWFETTQHTANQLKHVSFVKIGLLTRKMPFFHRGCGLLSPGAKLSLLSTSSVTMLTATRPIEKVSNEMLICNKYIVALYFVVYEHTCNKYPCVWFSYFITLTLLNALVLAEFHLWKVRANF